MTPSELVEAFKRAIRAQDGARVKELADDPVFANLSADDLNTILEDYSAYIQSKEVLDVFIAHPQLLQLSPLAIAEMLLAAIRLNHSKAIDSLLHHSKLILIPKRLIHPIIDEALEFGDRHLINLLWHRAPFDEALNLHLQGMIFCALRTHDREWLEQLFSHARYPEASYVLFREIFHWALQRKDKALIQLVIQHQKFNEEIEKSLLQEIFNTFLSREEQVKQMMDDFVLEQLMQHQDYVHFSHLLLTWMLEKTLEEHNFERFDQLKKHPQFNSLTAIELAELLLHVLPLKHQKIQEILVHHPAYEQISGDSLGLLLEQAVILNDRSAVEFISHHPHFDKIPDDAFKRVATLELESFQSPLRDDFLQNSAFNPKHRRMIDEAIRHNDSEVVNLFLNEPMLKHIVLEELIRYTTMDPYYVNPIIIRDILRQTIMTADHRLVAKLAQDALFDQHIHDLMLQSIQFDDDLLIEKIMLDPNLKTLFKQILKKTPVEGRQHLYKLFKEDTQKEITSWFEES